MFTFEGICLQEHSSDCLLYRIKCKAKQTKELVKFQSVLCEGNNRGLKITVTKIYRLIVIVYSNECKEVKQPKGLLVFTSSCEQCHTELRE